MDLQAKRFTETALEYLRKYVSANYEKEIVKIKTSNREK